MFSILGKALKKTLKGGLIVEDLKLGGGPESKPGNKNIFFINCSIIIVFLLWWFMRSF